MSGPSKLKKQRSENFMRQFRDKTNQEFINLSATQLLTIWRHYDVDGNGFIEGSELDQFLKEFVSSVCQNDVGTEVVSETMLAELKKDFLDAYDENGDGKIEIRELALLLPTDENFLLLFQLDNRIGSSIDFMKIWKQYDTDVSGSIEANELKGFLKDLLQQTTKHSVTDDKLDEYTKAILEIFDENKDGKLQLSELARLLPVKENVLCSALTKQCFKAGSNKVGLPEIEKIFIAYDKDSNGKLEGEEISGFVKDLMELMKPSFTVEDLKKFQELLMKSCDLDGDGTICKEELTLMLLGIQKYAK